MGSRHNKQPAFQEQWLVDACSSEIRAHRLIFLFVLCPLLGLWLPHLMFDLGLSVLVQVRGSMTGNKLGEGSRWLVVASIVSYAVPLGAVSFGLWRERRHQASMDRRAIAGAMKMPERQGLLLANHLKRIWDELTGGVTAPPRLVCQPNFDVLAHAYDTRDGQTIEVSAGLAGRVVQGDPMSVSILRHEVAHVVHKDLPAVRRQSIVAAAALLSATLALSICLGVTILIVVVMDLGRFPKPVTVANVVSVHLALLLAAFIVTLPLLLGRFVVRRYAGFIVTLVEIRADVSAGIWGEGLKTFSDQLKSDPSVRATTIRDIGLAYVSPTLSHLPAQERATLLAKPQRLTTPKLRYCAVAVGVIWFLTFHQGDEVWDVLLLSAAVALLQALAVQMVIRARGHVRLSPARAGTLALGLLAAQALPLISIEGLAYLAEHLTAAIVTPGGFGTAEDADYLRDTLDTFREFGGFVAQATGGVSFCLSVVAAASCFWLMSRLPAGATNRPKRLGTTIVAAMTFVASIALSYKFFQKSLYWPIRHAAFASSDPEWGSPDGFWGLVPTVLRHPLSQSLWEFSEFLHGPSILGSHAWLRLVLPNLTALFGALLIFGLFRKAVPLSARLSKGGNGQ